MAEAYRVVRPIKRVLIWNIRPAGAERLASRLGAEAVTDLAAATAEADIVSCATLAREPLIHGEWLHPGTHLDLIGGYRPDMREADDDAVRRARVFIDTDVALAEAGDLITPLGNGVLKREDIAGDLAALCRGTAAGRRTDEEITLFKAVGTALEDLAAAALVWQDFQG
jgi:ornithine cyclodeaminase